MTGMSHGHDTDPVLDLEIELLGMTSTFRGTRLPCLANIGQATDLTDPNLLRQFGV